MFAFSCGDGILLPTSFEILVSDIIEGDVLPVAHFSFRLRYLRQPPREGIESYKLPYSGVRTTVRHPLDLILN